MFIPRQIQSRLRHFAQQYPIVIVTGARQTGKTALLQATFPEASTLSLDLPTVAARANENPAGLLDPLASPTILEEVQYAPGIFRHLKARVDARPHEMGRFLLTASHTLHLSEATQHLKARAAILELDSLSVPELRGEPATANVKLANHLWRGGYPALYRQPDLTPSDFFRRYVVSFLERDLRQMMNVDSLLDFERFLRACAKENGQLLNLSELAREVGIAVSTARQWVSLLEAAHWIVLLEPWSGKIGKRMVKTPKLYFRDTGLLCFLLGLDSPAALLTSAHLGVLWQTFVLGEMHRAREAQGADAELCYFRDTHSTEVDFVLSGQGRVRLAVAKWTQSPDSTVAKPIRKVHPWLKDLAAEEHWVICGAQREVRDDDGVPVRLIDGSRFTNWFGN